mmetsp:Transcript_141949/g.258009  ORF Transcript_141949/g.258009 Transcript_141949/m.258009 type:complete len:191 (+) Transcript_141949:97-669(+)
MTRQFFLLSFLSIIVSAERPSAEIREHVHTQSISAISTGHLQKIHAHATNDTLALLEEEVDEEVDDDAGGYYCGSSDRRRAWICCCYEGLMYDSSTPCSCKCGKPDGVNFQCPGSWNAVKVAYNTERDNGRENPNGADCYNSCKGKRETCCKTRGKDLWALKNNCKNGYNDEPADPSCCEGDGLSCKSPS